MKKFKKTIGLVLAYAILVTMLSGIGLNGGAAFAAALSTSDALNSDYYSVVFGPVNYQDKEGGSVGSQFYSTGVYQKFLADGENIYMQAKTPLTTGASKTLNYPNWDGDFSADTAGKGGSGNYAVMGNSGEYVIQSKIMFHQTEVYESAWADMRWASNVTAEYADESTASIGYATNGDASISSDGNMTNFCDEVVDYISLKAGSIQKQSIGVIKTDVWYTIRETYNLDNDTTSFEIVHPDGTSYKYTASDSRLADATLTFVRYDASIKSIYGEGFSLDDFVIAKTVNKPVKVTFDGDAGFVSADGKSLASGDIFSIPYGIESDDVLTFTPAPGYVVSDVTVGGVSVGSLSSLRYDSITGDVEVTFEKITASTPFTIELYSEDYQDKEEGTSGAQFYSTGVYQKFLADGENIYMQAKTPLTTGASKTLSYPNWNGDFSADTAGKGGNGLYVAMGNSGEYTIESRFMFHQTAVSDETWADMLWRSNISLEGAKGTGNEKSIGWTTDGGSTAMTNFCDDSEDYISLKGNNSVQNKSIGILKTDTWYTIRETYNLETNTTTFEIIHPDGTSYKYETYDSRLDGANLSFIRYDVGIKNTNDEGFSMDDFKVKKTILKPIKVSYDSSMGSVFVDGSVVEPDSEAAVAYNSNLASVLNITPASGYRIADVKINGESKGAVVSSFEFKNVVKDQTVEVVFEEIPAENPAIVQTAIITNYNYNGHPAVFAYSKLNKFSNESSETYGIYLWKGGRNAEGVTKLKLESCDPDTNLPAIAKSEQAFCIAAYGAAIKVGEAYSIQSFVGDVMGEPLEMVLEEDLE